MTLADALPSFMTRYAVPITRESCLQVASVGEAPEPWTAELEANLPVELAGLEAV